MVKMHRDQRKRVDKDNRERRSRDLEDGEAEQDNLQHFSEKKKSSRRMEGFEAYSGPASHSEKNNLKSKRLLVIWRTNNFSVFKAPQFQFSNFLVNRYVQVQPVFSVF